MKKEYKPNLSKELKEHLSKQGTLFNFLEDYKQMCSNFKPVKIYSKKDEEKPKNYGELDDEKKRVLKRIGKEYAHATHQLLELALRLHKDKKEYSLIGGFGVLGHLYNHNPKFSLKWRGTADIDLLSKDKLNSYYYKLGFKKIPPERVNKSMIPDGILDSYTLENPYSDNPVKIQDRQEITFKNVNGDIASKIHKDSKIVNFYGVPIRIASMNHLISSKMSIRRRKDKFGIYKDKQDVEHLKSIKKLISARNKRGKP